MFCLLHEKTILTFDKSVDGKIISCSCPPETSKLSSAIPIEFSLAVGNTNGKVIVCIGDSNTPETMVESDVVP